MNHEKVPFSGPVGVESKGVREALLTPLWLKDPALPLDTSSSATG